MNRLPRKRSAASVGGEGRPICFWLVVALIALLVVAGGSARADTVMLLLLRPAMVVLTGAMLLMAAPGSFRGIRPLLWLLAALAVAIAVQLVPLPPAIWTRLPGREMLAEAAAIGGYAQPWMPISQAPDRTWNSLLALLPALAALLGVAALTDSQRMRLVSVLIIVTALAGVIGTLQIAAGADSIFYWYEIANRGAPTGFFANRNHFAIFMALVFPLLPIAWLLRRERHPLAREPFLLATAGFTIVMILVAGSRGGLLMMCAGVVGAAFLYGGSVRHPRPNLRWVIVAAILVVGAALATLTILLGRASALDRLLGVDLASEGRLANTPTVIEITRQMFPVGSGFGTFDPVYRRYEPDAVLDFTYFNNAHNDLLELALTGGLPAMLVLLAFIVWYVRSTYLVFRAPAAETRIGLARMASVSILMLLLASTADYPLRTPVLAAIFAIHCVLLQSGAGWRRSVTIAG